MSVKNGTIVLVTLTPFLMAGGLGICQLEAKSIAAEVGKEAVQIGRTGLRLRNTSNQPPRAR